MESNNYLIIINSIHIIISLIFGVSYFIDPFSYFNHIVRNDNSFCLFIYVGITYIFFSMYSVSIILLKVYDKSNDYDKEISDATVVLFLIYLLKLIYNIVLQFNNKINNWSNIIISLAIAFAFGLPMLVKIFKKKPDSKPRSVLNIDEQL